MPFTLYTQALGPLETPIMHLLWANGPMTIRQLHSAIARDIAYTTVMTTVDQMYEKGLVTREAIGPAKRSALYTPTVTRAQLLALVIEKMCADLAATTADRRAVREALGM